MATFGVQVTDAGIIVPSYANVLQQLKNFYWSIYGSDASLDADTQDGQFLSVLAQAITDCNQGAAAAYNSFSPTTAQGVSLSSLVKINGLARQVPTRSTAVVRLVGQVGTTINGGIVGDSLGLDTQWELPPSVTIPGAGEIEVTATCSVDGAVVAEANTLTVILTPTRGWQSVTNPAAAAQGEPVESDAQLRQRQSQSTSLPAQSVIEAVLAAVKAVSGVQRLQVYENKSDVTDSDGIPSHSISAVVLGGDTQQIGDTIARDKTPGTGTYGDIDVLVVDSRGVPAIISYFELSQISIKVEIDIDPLVGYSTAVGDQIKAAVAAYISGLNIGEDVYLARLFGAASLNGTVSGQTFVVNAIRQARDMNPPAAGNVVIAFNEAAICAVSDIDVTVL